MGSRQGESLMAETRRLVSEVWGSSHVVAARAWIENDALPFVKGQLSLASDQCQSFQKKYPERVRGALTLLILYIVMRLTLKYAEIKHRRALKRAKVRELFCVHILRAPYLFFDEKYWM